MNVITDKMTYFKVEDVKKAIDASNIPMFKISTMILDMEQTYVSKALRDGKINKDKLKTLCDFFGLEYDKIATTPTPKADTVQKTVNTPSQVINLDALILGVNQLYQLEKTNSELMTQLLEQVRATNVKLGRFENLIGQMHAGTLAIKENTKEIENVMRENKSSVAGIAGRVRALSQRFERVSV